MILCYSNFDNKNIPFLLWIYLFSKSNISKENLAIFIEEMDKNNVSIYKYSQLRNIE